MTIKEAFIGGLAGLQVSDALIERSIIQSGINDSSLTYSPSLHDELIDLAMMHTLFAVWGTYKSMSEGDMSVSFSDEMLKKLLFLAKKYGRKDIVDLLDEKPKLRAVRKW